MNKARKLIASLLEQSVKLDRSIFLYLEPHNAPANEQKQFAQCGTCPLFTGSSCYIHAPDLEVGPQDTCYLYAFGDPSPELKGKETNSVTPEESGFVKAHESRCENCRSFDNGTCLFFKQLNEKNPELFELDTTVKPLACCNAQVNNE